MCKCMHWLSKRNIELHKGTSREDTSLIMTLHYTMPSTPPMASHLNVLASPLLLALCPLLPICNVSCDVHQLFDEPRKCACEKTSSKTDAGDVVHGQWLWIHIGINLQLGGLGWNNQPCNRNRLCSFSDYVRMQIWKLHISVEFKWCKNRRTITACSLNIILFATDKICKTCVVYT